ncbi:MAG: plasmid pRiA4b ORF-3 family protein [Prevotellaceae bacterium]|jgi:hypothetical protein|nr:plasmid pRiA4b ORF-3 family protein [Prevotellaceae bacterium]
MAIYKYKIAISDNKNFARECEIEDSSTLYDFHRYIQNELDFDDAQLAIFFISNQNWERIKAIPLFDLGDGSMDSILIEDLVNDEENNLLYVFDMYHNRHLQVEFMFEVEATHRASYPRTVDAKGNPPNQFSQNVSPAELDDDEDEISGFETDELGMLSETDNV